MKLLNGSELAGYIKERQAKQVRRLRQQYGIMPKLAIVVTVNTPAINTYVRLKKSYGNDILINVDVFKVQQADTYDLLNKLNKDESIHGIIVQLPLEDPTKTEEIVNLVSPAKDVDGLGKSPQFEPATPLAILWLLSGYNIDLRGKDVLLVGQGRLVGAPLKQILTSSGLNLRVIDQPTLDLKNETLAADVIITATGTKDLITADMIKPGAIIVDAGVAGEDGKTVGDVDPKVYKERDDLTITPIKGGVGPLTVTALFENVINAARQKVES